MIKMVARKILPKKIRKYLLSYIAEENDLIFDLLNVCPSQSKIMIDVGAGHGSTFIRFAESGWQVHAFEPDDNNRNKIHELYPNLNSVNVDCRAVSNTVQKGVDFFRSALAEGLSTLSIFDKSHVKCGIVDTVTLDEYCKEKNIKDIGFLKVDAEGYDLLVLCGLSFNAIKPEMVMCEFEDNKTERLGYTLKAIIRHLNDNGYHVLVSEWYPAVKRGGPHSWRGVKLLPFELEDKNAWGNVIGIQDYDSYMILLDMFDAKSKKWLLGSKLARYV